MSYAFAHNDNRRVVRRIDVSNVTNMSDMFNGANMMYIEGIEDWDVSKVTNMKNLFTLCTFTSLDLSKWDTSKVSNMDYAFNMSSLKSLSSLRADSLSISSYLSPFGSNYSLVDFGGFINLKSNWNGSYSVETLKSLSHQSLVNILNGLYDFIGNSETPKSSQGKIRFGSTHLANLSEEEIAIATNKGWTLT
jgi:surface protein